MELVFCNLALLPIFPICSSAHLFQHGLFVYSKCWNYFLESGGRGLDGVPSDDGSGGGVRTGRCCRRWMEHLDSSGERGSSFPSTPLHTHFQWTSSIPCQHSLKIKKQIWLDQQYMVRSIEGGLINDHWSWWYLLFASVWYKAQKRFQPIIFLRSSVRVGPCCCSAKVFER